MTWKKKLRRAYNEIIRVGLRCNGMPLEEEAPVSSDELSLSLSERVHREEVM